jgi:hypothetical protein
MYNDVSKQAKNKLKKATFIINGGDWLLIPLDRASIWRNLSEVFDSSYFSESTGIDGLLEISVTWSSLG